MVDSITLNHQKKVTTPRCATRTSCIIKIGFKSPPFALRSHLYSISTFSAPFQQTSFFCSQSDLPASPLWQAKHAIFHYEASWDPVCRIFTGWRVPSSFTVTSRLTSGAECPSWRSPLTSAKSIPSLTPLVAPTTRPESQFIGIHQLP